MEKKGAGFILLKGGRYQTPEPPPTPQPAGGVAKRFFGNQGTAASVRRMYRIWARKVGSLYRIEAEAVDVAVIDSIADARFEREKQKRRMAA